MIKCTSFDDFSRHFNSGKTQLVWKFHPGDLETPVSTYLKLCQDQKNCFLLESIEGGENLGRYSIIGMQPDLIWSYRADSDESDPLKTIRKHLKDAHIDIVPEQLPPMAVSGLFGYMGYDMVRSVENIPDTNPDPLGIPDSTLMRPQLLVIFDNAKNIMCFVTPIYSHAQNTKETAKKIYDQAQKKIQSAIEAIEQQISKDLINSKTKLPETPDISSNMSPEAFKDAVRTATNYIQAGDIFQVVLSQRFSMAFDLPAFALYRSLRTLNPSPFMVHMQLDGFALVASSPEILVRVRDNTVTIRPIAGTRKRGKNTAEDQALATDLLSDEKECAEHLMLLDLGRNDVGRVSEFGTVKVTEKFIIEHYSHVMHIVSNVEGQLRGTYDIIDAHFAGFPAGTVSGAPKVRAMEIIDELEDVRRGYYGGSIGYFSSNGTMDTCIALRTALVKDGRIHIQAGAGIVADSNPDSEHQETINKANAILSAAQNALTINR